jgi:hypothetical protein
MNNENKINQITNYKKKILLIYWTPIITIAKNRQDITAMSEGLMF